MPHVGYTFILHSQYQWRIQDFQDRKVPTHEGERQSIIYYNFCWNCIMKMTEFGPKGRRTRISNGRFTSATEYLVVFLEGFFTVLDGLEIVLILIGIKGIHKGSFILERKRCRFQPVALFSICVFILQRQQQWQRPKKKNRFPSSINEPQGWRFSGGHKPWVCICPWAVYSLNAEVHRFRGSDHRDSEQHVVTDLRRLKRATRYWVTRTTGLNELLD